MHDDHSASRRVEVLQDEAPHLIAENRGRALDALEALLHYPKRENDLSDPEQLEGTLTDLVADVLHLADERIGAHDETNETSERLLARARRHYLAERGRTA